MRSSRQLPLSFFRLFKPLVSKIKGLCLFLVICLLSWMGRRGIHNALKFNKDKVKKDVRFAEWERWHGYLSPKGVFGRDLRKVNDWIQDSIVLHMLRYYRLFFKNKNTKHSYTLKLTGRGVQDAVSASSSPSFAFILSSPSLLRPPLALPPLFHPFCSPDPSLVSHGSSVCLYPSLLIAQYP